MTTLYTWLWTDEHFADLSCDYWEICDSLKYVYTTFVSDTTFSQHLPHGLCSVVCECIQDTQSTHSSSTPSIKIVHQTMWSRQGMSNISNDSIFMDTNTTQNQTEGPQPPPHGSPFGSRSDFMFYYTIVISVLGIGGEYLDCSYIILCIT